MANKVPMKFRYSCFLVKAQSLVVAFGTVQRALDCELLAAVELSIKPFNLSNSFLLFFCRLGATGAARRARPS